MITKYLSGNGVSEGLPARRLAGRLRSIGLWLAEWVDTRADRRAAAEMRLQLAALSDAELARRGFSRAMLASDVLATTQPRSPRRERQHGGFTQKGFGPNATDASPRWRRSVA